MPVVARRASRCPKFRQKHGVDVLFAPTGLDLTGEVGAGVGPARLGARQGGPGDQITDQAGVVGHVRQQVLKGLLQALGADDKTLAQVQRALAGSNSLQAEINGHDRERRSVTLGLDLQPIQQPLPGFIAVLVDLSEVVAQRNKTQALLAALPSGVMLRSAQGRVIDCNPAAETMLQLSRAQILGTLPTPDGWQALHPDLAPMAADEHPGRQVLRSGYPVTISWRDRSFIFSPSGARCSWAR